MNATPLRTLRYHYAIWMSSGYWLLVLPVASSMLVTLWMMALATTYNEANAYRIGELMMPVLGAFLAAHAMAPEYRSGIGAVLASKPVSLHRVVALRVVLALALAALLTAMTLVLCGTLVAPAPVGLPLLAALPSLLALASLALLFATLTRNALAGFAVAGVVWALDVALGYSVHPLLSLQAASALAARENLGHLWPWNKAALLLVALILLAAHDRQLRRIQQLPERRDLIRYAVVAGVGLLLYCVSGAILKVGYGWFHKGHLLPSDAIWHRHQLAIYQPLPVAWLFGPAYATLTRPPLSDREREESAERNGTANPRIAELQAAVERWPRSIWADCLAYELAAEQLRSGDPGALASYQRVVERFPTSPLAPRALRTIIADAVLGAPPEVREAAARLALARYPHDDVAEDAALLLVPSLEGRGAAAEAAEIARRVADTAPEFRRPYWHKEAGRLALVAGRPDAREELNRAIALADRLMAAYRQDPTGRSDLAPRLAEIGRVKIEAERLLRPDAGGRP